MMLGKRCKAMIQEERWQKRYEEVKAFIETNHRNPSMFFHIVRVLEPIIL
jgi:hypothetical protein